MGVFNAGEILFNERFRGSVFVDFQRKFNRGARRLLGHYKRQRCLLFGGVFRGGGEWTGRRPGTWQVVVDGDFVIPYEKPLLDLGFDGRLEDKRSILLDSPKSALQCRVVHEVGLDGSTRKGLATHHHFALDGHHLRNACSRQTEFLPVTGVTEDSQKDQADGHNDGQDPSETEARWG